MYLSRATGGVSRVPPWRVPWHPRQSHQTRSVPSFAGRIRYVPRQDRDESLGHDVGYVNASVRVTVVYRPRIFHLLDGPMRPQFLQ